MGEVIIILAGVVISIIDVLKFDTGAVIGTGMVLSVLIGATPGWAEHALVEIEVFATDTDEERIPEDCNDTLSCGGSCAQSVLLK